MGRKLLLAIGFLTVGLCIMLAQTNLRIHEYWLDDNYDQKITVSSANATQQYQVDLSALPIGIHYFNHRSQNDNGEWGAMTRNVFYLRQADADLSENTASLAGYEYWLDDDYVHKIFVSSSKDVNEIEIDLGNLGHGTHLFNYREVNADGRWGAISRSAFYMRSSDDELTETVSPLAGNEYWLDDDYEHRVYKKSTSSSMVASISFEDLKPGVHYLNFRSHNEAGRWGAMTRNAFYLHEADLTSDEGAQIIGYRYKFNDKATYVALEPCDEFALENKIISLPEFTEFASLDDGCTYEFSGINVRLARENTSVFNLQFENENHKWSCPAIVEIAVVDTLDRTPVELQPQNSVILEKVPSGDFNAIRIEISETNNYYFKATQPCRIDLYGTDGNLYKTIGSNEIVNICEVGLLEGTYYGIVRDHVTDNEFTDTSVIIRLLLTEGFTPNPQISFADGLLTITAMDGAKIYYTLDGSNPTDNSAIYSEPVSVFTNCTAKAIAKHPDLAMSEISTYKIDAYKVAKPEVMFTNLKLYMSCSTPDSQLYFTVDGTEPSDKSTLYTEPVAINFNCTVKVVGKRDGYNDSDVVEYQLDVENLRCVTPVFTREDNILFLSSLTEGVTFYYTLDGNNLDAIYEVYNGGITLTHNGLVKAYCSKDGYLNSETVSYTVDWLQTSTPKFNLDGETLAIVCDSPDSEIYYTIGGNEPNRGSIKYAEPIKLTDNKVVKAIAYAPYLNDSEVAEFIPNIFTCKSVEIKYNGRYASLETSTKDAIIYYTIDGSTPTRQSFEYIDTFDACGLTDVKAIAVKQDFNDSEIATYKVEYYYDGVDATITSPGQLFKAFDWCDKEDITTLNVIGTVNSEDIAFLANLPSLAYLNLSEANIAGNTLAANAFAGSEMVSISLPKSVENVGASIFTGCKNLAAIVWNATTSLSSSAIDGINNPNLLLYVKHNSYAPSTIRNVVVNGVAENITLSDSELANFYVPEEFTAKKISYTHGYSMETVPYVCAGWETLALPFDVQKITHATKGEMAPFTANNQSAKPFWLCTLDSYGFVDAAEIKANTPYIIAMPNNIAYADEYVLVGDVTFSAENATVPKTAPESVERNDFSFIPTTLKIDKGNSVYPINKHAEYEGYQPGSIFVGNLRDVNPFEAYLGHEEAGAQRRLYSISEIGGDPSISGLQNVSLTDAEMEIYVKSGVLYIRSPRKQRIAIYSTSGVLARDVMLEEGLNRIPNLQGLYIVRNKPIVIR